jgi:hypothetical protein
MIITDGREEEEEEDDSEAYDEDFEEEDFDDMAFDPSYNTDEDNNSGMYLSFLQYKYFSSFLLSIQSYI